MECRDLRFRIYHPKNLYGFVSITDNAAALAYLRFFSSRTTYAMLDLGGIVEIAPETTGRRIHEVFTVPPAQFSKVFADPVVEVYDDPLEGKVFVVQRYVVALDQHVYRLKERVTEHGDYELQQRTSVAPDAAQYGITHFGEN